MGYQSSSEENNSNFDTMAFDELIYLAQILYDEEEFFEMKNIMKIFINKKLLKKNAKNIGVADINIDDNNIDNNNGIDLNNVERNLLFSAYTNCIEMYRNNINKINSLLNDKNNNENTKLNILKKAPYVYLKNSIEKMCDEIINIINDLLLTNKNMNVNDKVHYLTHKAIFFTELIDIRKDYIDKACDIFNEAYSILISENGKENMSPINYYRVKFIYNYCTFLHEIMNDRERSCDIGRLAYENAYETYQEEEATLNFLKSINDDDDDDDDVKKQGDEKNKIQIETKLVVRQLEKNIEKWTKEYKKNNNIS